MAKSAPFNNQNSYNIIYNSVILGNWLSNVGQSPPWRATGEGEI